MTDFGFWELAMVGIVALLVVGPQRLPEVARQAGAWIGKMKRFVTSVQADAGREFQADELKRALDEQRDEIAQLKGAITDAEIEAQAEVRPAGKAASVLEGKAAQEHASHGSAHRTGVAANEDVHPTTC